jgi:ribosomal protein S18 acetylase RimI-like enzyme
VRPARSDDVEIVADLAVRSLQSYRFFVDPLIPQARARHSRREWVRNAFAGRAEAIYVAERSGRIVGFVLLKSKSGLKDLQHEENPNKIGVIDLIVVDSKYEGLGLGKGLVTQAIRHYHGTASAVEVGTQGKNIRAIGLYTRMGFFLVGSEFSLHKHAELTSTFGRSSNE